MSRSQIFISLLCQIMHKGLENVFRGAVRWSGHHSVGLAPLNETLSAGGCIKSLVWSRGVVHLKRNLLFVMYWHEISISYVIVFSATCCYF